MTDISRKETAFIELLRSGMFATPPDLSVFSGLSAAEWERIYDMARRQTVCGICYSTITQLPDDLLPYGALLPRWVARVDVIEKTNRAMRRAAVKLVTEFRGAGLRPIVQKGLSVARFYTNPEFRECGDIDIWLPGPEMKGAVALAARFDPSPVRHADGSVSFKFSGFVVELHKTLVNVSNPKTARILDSFAVKECFDNGYADMPIPSPSPLFELLLVDSHIMHHAVGTGIGLRHVCDYILVSAALKGKYDRKSFESFCRLAGLSKWTALLNAFAERYLGVDSSLLPPSGWNGKGKLPIEKLYDIISEGGNFGHHSRNKNLSERIFGKGKLHTLAMIVRRSRFSASVSPSEWGWNFFSLMIGQFNS